VCPETGEALAVDPLAYGMCLSLAKDNGWEITQVLNTHEHGDHTGGNQGVIEATGARLLAHVNAKDSIPGMDVGLGAGDIIKVGKTIEMEALDTPGHTMSHVCVLSHTDTPGLFSGDTLFNAGAGNCHNGGHPDELYDTFADQLSKLPDNTLVYPGHDYMINNLEFTLDREPDNEQAPAYIKKLKDQDPNTAYITSLAEEKQINTFFRLQNPTVIAQLRESFPELPDNPDSKTVFLKLRELRNKW
jgi:hydroxyacylglutathione hydrolase